MRFVIRDPKKGSSGSFFTSTPRSGRHSPYPVVTVAFLRDDAPYVVFCPLPGTRPEYTSKRRFAYFPAVVHFRKVVISQKVGSHRNGSPVI